MIKAGTLLKAGLSSEFNIPLSFQAIFDVHNCHLTLFPSRNSVGEK